MTIKARKGALKVLSSKLFDNQLPDVVQVIIQKGATDAILWQYLLDVHCIRMVLCKRIVEVTYFLVSKFS